MGHGAEYKKFLNVSEVGFANQITFIHNSYLWVVVKLGLLGVFSIGLLVFSTFRQSKFALLKGGNSQIVGIAGASTIIVFMVTGLTSPVWGQSSDLVAFSLLAICLASAANSSIERNI
jgi:O-antigen ligase